MNIDYMKFFTIPHYFHMNKVSARPNTRSDYVSISFDKNWERSQGWDRFAYSIFLFIEDNIPDPILIWSSKKIRIIYACSCDNSLNDTF